MNHPRDLDSAPDSSGDAEPAPRIPDHLFEAGLRAVFAAGEHQPQSAVRAHDEEVPRQIGRYEITGVIGRGGVGVVLKGLDAELGREIAIKLLLATHQGSTRMKQRFLEEAQVAGQLEHPGIVSVHEAGLFGDRPYFCMKLVKGRTLAALLQERHDPGAERIRFLGILEQVAQTVAYAHSRGVIHRDLKPSNIMVGAFGEVQVMDWGLVKVVARGPSEARPPSESPPPEALVEPIRSSRTGEPDSKSLAGSVMGTPAYMSPEQARGEVETLDARADVFGLGTILCEILTGQPPFRGKTTEEIVRKARGGEIDDALLRLEACGADSELLSLARACLATDRKDRLADAGAVAEAMKAHRETLDARARRSALDATEARVRADGERRARLLTIGLAAAVCVAVFLAGGGYLWFESQRRDRSRASEDTVSRAMAEAHQLRGLSGLGAGKDPAVDLARLEAALAAARRAEERAGSDVEARLRQEAKELRARLESDLERVRQAKARAARNLRTVDELERIRAAFLDDHDPRKTNAKYSKSFQEILGAGIESLEAGAAAALLKESGISGELASALDDWARARREIRGKGALPWKSLLLLAEMADPHPWRDKLREAVRNEDAAALQQLKRTALLEIASAADFGLLATELSTHGDLAGALSVLQLARERYPGDFWVLIKAASYSIFANRIGLHQPPRHEEPIRYLTAARALRPENTQVHALFSKALLDKREVQAAIEEARKGLGLRPDDAALFTSLGLALAASGNLEGALEAYHKAIDIDPDESTTHVNLGVVLADRGDFDAALSSMAKSVELNPEDGVALCGLGSVLFALGRKEEAFARLKSATELFPDFAMAHQNLGYAFLRSHRLEESVSALKAAVQKNPAFAMARNNLGTAFLELKRHAEAITEFMEAIRLEPANAYPYGQLLDILEDEKVVDPGKPLEDLILALDRLISSSESSHTLAARTFVTAWCRRPQTLDHAVPLKVADLEVRRTDHQDPKATRLLGRVLSIAGRPRDAVLALEESLGSPDDPPWVSMALAAARAALLPDLVSFASIDAAVDHLGVSVTLERAREGFAAFRAIARGVEASARRHYLEGRLLARSGSHVEAAAELREVLTLDHLHPEPYIRLWESLRAGADPQRARRLFRDEVARSGLPARTLPAPAERPRNLEPAAGATVVGESLELRAMPFDHIDPRVKLTASRWQIRRPHGNYSRDPTLDIETGVVEGTLRVPPGLLVPATEYSWRVRQVGSDGRASEYGEESSFTTLPAALEAVQMDLTANFNRDVVADPGDQENDSFDADEGSLLLVEGFDGERDGVPGVRGLPRDAIVGVHRLGDPRGLNVIQLAPSDKDPVRVAIPRGRYVCIRFLVAGGNGNSTVPVTFELADGGMESHDLLCDDWYRDFPPSRYHRPRAGSIPIWNGMDRLARGKLELAHEPTLFEVLLPVSSDKELVALSLRPTGASFDSPRTRFHLFAATGMRRTDAGEGAGASPRPGGLGPAAESPPIPKDEKPGASRPPR